MNYICLTDCLIRLMKYFHLENLPCTLTIARTCTFYTYIDSLIRLV